MQVGRTKRRPRAKAFFEVERGVACEHEWQFGKLTIKDRRQERPGTRKLIPFLRKPVIIYLNGLHTLLSSSHEHKLLNDIVCKK